jgi:hypothetical protein
MSEPTISVFFDDPEGYAQWLDAHPDGWLLNAGTSYGPMIHHATCDHIPRARRARRRTSRRTRSTALATATPSSPGPRSWGSPGEFPVTARSAARTLLCSSASWSGNAALERAETRAAMDEED